MLYHGTRGKTKHRKKNPPVFEIQNYTSLPTSRASAVGVAREERRWTGERTVNTRVTYLALDWRGAFFRRAGGGWYSSRRTRPATRLETRTRQKLLFQKAAARPHSRKSGSHL